MNTTRPRYRPPAPPAGLLGHFRARLRALREGAGLTMHALSAAAGLSPAVVSQLESGQSAPSLGTLVALAGALGVPPAELLAGWPKKIPKKSSRAIDTAG